MSSEVGTVAPPSTEVPMVEAEAVRQMRDLAGRGWGAKRIARELGLARNTVRRYLRGGPAAEVQERPASRRLDEATRSEAVSMFETTAEGNAVVVAQLLAERGIEASVRTVQRAVADRRRELRAVDLASVRFETAPGRQMQIDFGERRVWIADQQVKVHFLVAVLSYSRRIFARAFLHERQHQWLDGIASAFCHFGGVPSEGSSRPGLRTHAAIGRRAAPSFATSLHHRATRYGASLPSPSDRPAPRRATLDAPSLRCASTGRSIPRLSSSSRGCSPARRFSSRRCSSAKARGKRRAGSWRGSSSTGANPTPTSPTSPGHGRCAAASSAGCPRPGHAGQLRLVPPCDRSLEPSPPHPRRRGRTSTPSAASLARMEAASAAAPGVSP